MRLLYHIPLSPHCRKIRLALAEKGLAFELAEEPVWTRRPAFLALNPAGMVPVLVDEDGTVLSESTAIAEYLEEIYDERPLFGDDAQARAETRRLVNWFDLKFGEEVTANLVGEKIMRRLASRGGPNSELIRAGKHNIHYHLDYIAYLTERRRWLAGERFTLADITAGAHLSSVDYLGDVPWEAHEEAKQWYMRIKSRPSFRPLLADHVSGFPPPKHYADLDF